VFEATLRSFHGNSSFGFEAKKQAKESEQLHVIDFFSDEKRVHQKAIKKIDVSESIKLKVNDILVVFVLLLTQFAGLRAKQD